MLVDIVTVPRRYQDILYHNFVKFSISLLFYKIHTKDCKANFSDQLKNTDNDPTSK